jgi:nickel-dependent lactate racemase
LVVQKTVKVKTNYWEGDNEVELNFPEGWDVREKLMAGHNLPPLTSDQITAALRKPIGSKTLAEIAEGKKTATIAFSDMHRGDLPKAVAPNILEELHRGGIKDEDITFICALGAHKSVPPRILIKKLGADIVEDYLVFNHNVYDHHVEKGTTSRGTPVEVNRGFATSDVKIGIGGLIAHGFMGYGGGGKVILPGVVSLNTIETNHRRVAEARARGRAGYGVMNNNVIRLDTEETARLAGLDFKVDMIYNNDKLPLGVFAGDFVEEHRAGIEFAKEVYTTVPEKEMDVVVASSYPGEPGKASWAPNASVKEGGDVVIISGEGHQHYIYGQYGREYGGHLGGEWPREPGNPFPKAGRVINLRDNHPKKTNTYGTNVKTWAEVLELLKQDQGESAKVAVYPYCAIAMPPFPANY